MAIQRTIVLPHFDNDGVSLATEIDKVLCDIKAVAGGYSAHEGHGIWVDPTTKQEYYDEHLCVTVTSEEATDWKLQQRIYVWCDLLRQVSIYAPWREVHEQLFYSRKVAA